MYDGEDTIKIYYVFRKEADEVFSRELQCWWYGTGDRIIPDLYDIVPKEEIAEFEDIMRKIITGIISEASGIATWVYVQKYEKAKTSYTLSTRMLRFGYE